MFSGVAVSFILRFYIPTIFSIYCLGFYLFPSAYDETYFLKLVELVSSIPMMRISTLEQLEPILNRETVPFGISLISFIVATSIDISKFFPQKIYFRVYYDLVGIRERLAVIENKIPEIKIAKNWEERVIEYDKLITRELNSLIDNSNDFLSPEKIRSRDIIKGSGRSTIISCRLGPLSYIIDDSEGRIRFTIEDRNKKREFICSFKLSDSKRRFIQPNFGSIFRNYTIISPEYLEAFDYEDLHLYGKHHHKLLAVSKMTFLPFPNYSDTVYLWSPDGKIDSYIPIGYCAYERNKDNMHIS